MTLLDLVEPQARMRRDGTESEHLFDETIAQLWDRRHNREEYDAILRDFAESIIPQAMCKRYAALLPQHSEIGRWATKSGKLKKANTLSLLVYSIYRSNYCHVVKRRVISVSYSLGKGAISLSGFGVVHHELPETPGQITQEICEVLESLISQGH